MSLAWRGIVVTRPRELAQGLASLIERAGGVPLLFPAIEIRDIPAPAALQRLDEFDLAIFVSPTAVDRIMRQVKFWPPALRAAAVGAGTMRELEKRGITSVIAPVSGADSEALLASNDLEPVAGNRVVIFRGQGGRALLGDTLKDRGASVEYAECYRRTQPHPDPTDLLESWDEGVVHAVTVSSAEGLSNLFSMLGARGSARLRETPLFVPHPRVAEHAARLGVHETVIAGPGDDEMFERLVAYFAK